MLYNQAATYLHLHVKPFLWLRLTQTVDLDGMTDCTLVLWLRKCMLLNQFHEMLVFSDGPMMFQWPACTGGCWTNRDMQFYLKYHLLPHIKHFTELSCLENMYTSLFRINKQIIRHLWQLLSQTNFSHILKISKLSVSPHSSPPLWWI